MGGPRVFGTDKLIHRVMSPNGQVLESGGFSPTADAHSVARRCCCAEMTLAAEKRSSSGLLKGGSSAPQLPPIDSMAPSRSMPPRRLSLSVGSMKPRSRQSMLVSTAALGIEDKPVSVQARLRAERARKQRAERVERPNKKRGAHAREALRNDGPTWWTMPGKVSDSCEAFDRRHRNRWDTSETLIFSLQRDVCRPRLEPNASHLGRC